MKPKKENGGALVEFAVISPLLFLILFGTIEFGVLLYDKAVLTNACREGARAGIIFSEPRPTRADIETVVKDYCEDFLISFAESASPSVDVPALPTDSGDPLTVRVDYLYHFLVFSTLINFMGGSMDGTIILSAESVMRLE